MHSNDEFQYDPKTDTVRVSRRDLARLLLQFRTELENNASEDDQWRHMHDYDVSFERLADAVNSGSRPGTEPDERLRCKRTPAYKWPDLPPYQNGNGTGADPARITGGYGTHYVVMFRQTGRALCGLNFTREEHRKSTGTPDCAVCVREMDLMAAIPRPEETPAT
ncbi:hypothetical protein [[Kitasatospora] papulosa]|uniref:hypothetical protein n=1 Tax=[Kitasatospora] papulosa TaxID=1464011 RepID=UPI0037220FF8